MEIGYIEISLLPRNRVLISRNPKRNGNGSLPVLLSWFLSNEGRRNLKTCPWMFRTKHSIKEYNKKSICARPYAR